MIAGHNMLRAETALFLLSEEGLFLASLQRRSTDAELSDRRYRLQQMPVDSVNQEAPIA
jgi:hypothetical protein